MTDDAVKLLSDDEVAIIESDLKEWDGGSRFPASWNNIRALCATVRALRAELACYCRCHVRVAVRQQSCTHCNP